MTAPLLYRTEVLVDGLLDDLGTDWDEVDHVLLVGGSTRMPQVKERLALWTRPEKVLRSQRVDELVALGAAVQAGLETLGESSPLVPAVRGSLGRLRVADVTSQGLGILVRSASTGGRENSVVIPRNTRIPAAATKRYGTAEDGQVALRLEVTQGDDADPAYVSVLGTQELPVPIPPGASRVRAGTPFDITFRYDAEQVITIEVHGTDGRFAGRFDLRNEINLADADVATAAVRLQTIGSA